MIPQDAIDEFFEELKARGESPVQRRRWEFYFCDHDRAALERMRCAVIESGYKNVEVWDPAPENDDKELMFLHFELVAELTPEQLSERCVELDELAVKLGVESFDGFEVSNVDKSPIERS